MIELKTNREVFILWQLLNLEPKSKNPIFKRFKNPIETFWGKDKIYSKYELVKRIGKCGDVSRILDKFIEIGILKEKNDGLTIDVNVIADVWEDSIYPRIGKKIDKLKPIFD